MSDDLVKRLRYCAPERRDCSRNELAMLDAADLIEKLEAALRCCASLIAQVERCKPELLEYEMEFSLRTSLLGAIDYARKALEGKDE
jgi:hypothetical protein